MKSKIYAYLTLFLMFACVLSCSEENDPAPQAAATFTADKATAQVDETIQFTNTSQNATAFKWSFGDGTTSKEVSPSKSYQSSGTFLVSLVSTGEGGSTISTMTITVVPLPAFTVEDVDNLIALTPVQFTNASKGAASYLWSFGNTANSTSTEENPTFSYLSAGTYTVTLTATSAQGSSTTSQTIRLTAASPELYFTDTGAGFMEKLALDGSGTLTHVLDVNGMGGVGLAYDSVHGNIYFTDFEVAGAGKVWRMNLDGTGLEAIVTDIADDPYGLTIDIAGGKIYWGDDGGHISRANLDGTGKVDLIDPTDIPDAQYRSNVGLDLVNSKMYFIDYNAENVWMAGLDGSNPTIVVPDVFGYNVFVDQVNSKIYINDDANDFLLMADLDGSNIVEVDDTGGRIYGITIDYSINKLYWSNYTEGEIYMADLDGSNKETLKSGLDSPRGIFLRK